MKWVDSASSGDWRSLEDIANESLGAIVSVGWVLSEDDEKIILVPNVTSDKLGCNEMLIPKVAIVEMHEIVGYDA